MDIKKMGDLIANRRKENCLTQQELADKLSVTVQAVSKWECGKGIPDSSFMLKLADALGVTVTELLCGEKISSDRVIEKAEENTVALLREVQKRRVYSEVSEDEKKILKKEFKETTSAKLWAKLNIVSIFQSVFWITLFCVATFAGWGQIETTIILILMVLNATVPLTIALVRLVSFSLWLNIAKGIKEDNSLG